MRKKIVKILTLFLIIIFVVSITIFIGSKYSEKNKKSGVMLKTSPADEAAMKDEARNRLSPADETAIKEREEFEKMKLAMPIDESRNRLSPADEERIKEEGRLFEN